MRFLECLKSFGKSLQGKKSSLVNDEEVINLSHAKVYVFSDSATKNLENDHSDRCLTGSTKNGTRHRVLPPVGGNGVDPGGLP